MFDTALWRCLDTARRSLVSLKGPDCWHRIVSPRLRGWANEKKPTRRKGDEAFHEALGSIYCYEGEGGR